MSKQLFVSSVFAALLMFTGAHAEASEVTGTLTAGAAATTTTPDPDAGTISGNVTGGNGGTLSGTVTGGNSGSLSGTVTGGGGGSSSGSGGGGGGGGGGNNNNDDDDFGVVTPAPNVGGDLVTYPGFPNAGYEPLVGSTTGTAAALAFLLAILGYGAFRLKQYLS